MSHQRANVVIIWWRRWLRPKGATRSLNPRVPRGIERVSEGVRLAVQWGVAIEIERAIKTSARFC